MFTHQGHPVDRESHKRFKGVELSNEINSRLRQDWNDTVDEIVLSGKRSPVSKLDPRVLGCRVKEDGSQDKTPLVSIDQAFKSEWVFWQRDHDESN